MRMPWTVGQLIEELSRFPLDVPVLVDADDISRVFRQEEVGVMIVSVHADKGDETDEKLGLRPVGDD